jgi:hypothetical protein
MDALSSTLDNHRKRISNAAQIPPGPERDAALLSALRSISTELKAAEENHARAVNRVTLTKQVFDLAAGLLSGYTANHAEEGSTTVGVDGRKRRGGGNSTRMKSADGEFHAVDDDDDNNHQFKLPDSGPLPPIPPAISGGGLSSAQIVAHRDAFYRKLCGVSPAELHSYTPPQTSHNLKSRSQLDQFIYIASHWETGTETMEVMEFRRLHKSFYTKMQLSKENIGRRTRQHLRDIAGSTNNSGDGNNNGKAFCQYGKNDESLMYLCVDELYDAIFAIHCVDAAGDGGVGHHHHHHHHHRTALQCKLICNRRYANIPQDQIKAFVETCPICSSSKRSSTSSATSLKRQRIVNLEE